MKLPKTKIGDILHLKFWDHSDAEGDEEYMLCFEVFGRLVEENSYYYKVVVWGYPGDRVGDHNTEFMGIVKGACTYVRVLK